MAENRLEQTEASIRRGVNEVGEKYGTAVKPGQSPVEQYLNCDSLHVAREALLNKLISYDAMVMPGSPLMDKGVTALEKHEMPAQCSTYKPPKGPRIIV